MYIYMFKGILMIRIWIYIWIDGEVLDDLGLRIRGIFGYEKVNDSLYYILSYI